MIDFKNLKFYDSGEIEFGNQTATQQTGGQDEYFTGLASAAVSAFGPAALQAAAPYALDAALKIASALQSLLQSFNEATSLRGAQAIAKSSSIF